METTERFSDLFKVAQLRIYHQDSSSESNDSSPSVGKAASSVELVDAQNKARV